MNKNTIFISHATPDDNYFATWLASKLQLLGYKVWIDLENLRAGDSFKTVIKPTIKNESKVFLALTTENYVEKSNQQTSGVTRELNCATTVKIDEFGHNFIFPIKVDDVEFDDFPYHYMGLKAINFSENWQSGLIELVNELEKLGVEKNEKSVNPINSWFKVIQVENKTIEKKEKYYSNWFEFKLPENIYIHEPEVFIKQENYTIDYPYITEANKIISFANKETINRFTRIANSYPKNIEYLFSNNDLEIHSKFTLKEPKKKLIKLLNKTFEEHLWSCNLIKWDRGKKSRRRIFYFRKDEKQKRISLKRYNKSSRSLFGTTKEKINGKSQESNWAFAISGKAFLEPAPHFKISYSTVFSDENLHRFDTDLQHKLRRSVPSEWFNRKWMEMLFAAMLKISPNLLAEKILVKIDENKYLEINNEPANSFSDIGYNEPI